LSLAWAGQPDRAVAEAADLTRGGKWRAGQVYSFACIYAVSSDKRPAKRAEFAARAVELLAKAIAAGFRDLGHMRTDSDLGPLRGRLDCRMLLGTVREVAPTPRPAR
jgi:hypothetical protein